MLRRTAPRTRLESARERTSTRVGRRLRNVNVSRPRNVRRTSHSVSGLFSMYVHRLVISPRTVMSKKPRFVSAALLAPTARSAPRHAATRRMPDGRSTGRADAITCNEDFEPAAEEVSNHPERLLPCRGDFLEGRVTESVRDVIIIGGGPAGYTAALYAARANLEPLVIEGFAWGGQLMITSDVENYPGYPDGVLGPEMMNDFRRQAERFGSEFLTDDVTEVDFSEYPLRVSVGDDDYLAKSVIVATGANARQLGIDSERTLQGRGVSYCAVCDAAFFREKEIVVVGGGDSAMEEATFLTKFADKVTVVHRRDDFRASPIMLDRARANDKIEWVTNAVVDEVVGDVGVTGVRVRDVNTDELSELPADGLFVAIGHDPNTELFVGQLEMDEHGYLITHDGTATNVEGVFAAGDVVDHTYRQAITAAGMGSMAALDAERWLTSRA